MRLLVVDDDREFAEDLAVVEPEDVEIVAAAGAEEALRVMNAQSLDAVILDLDMPPVLASESPSEGLALLGAIVGGRRGSLPVIVATDTDDDDALMWCGRMGASAVVRKSAGLTGIFAAVRAATSGDAHWNGGRVTHERGSLPQVGAIEGENGECVLLK